MKKLSLLLLATIYFICASGVFVHAHFCADELSSVRYFELNDGHQCGCGDEEANANCCKDVFHFYKVDAHQDANFVKASDVFSFKLISLNCFTIIFKNLVFRAKNLVFNSHAPPPFLYGKASKLIVNSVFRI